MDIGKSAANGNPFKRRIDSVALYRVSGCILSGGIRNSTAHLPACNETGCYAMHD